MKRCLHNISLRISDALEREGRFFMAAALLPEQMSGCKHRPSAVSCRVTPRCR